MDDCVEHHCGNSRLPHLLIEGDYGPAGQPTTPLPRQGRGTLIARIVGGALALALGAWLLAGCGTSNSGNQTAGQNNQTTTPGARPTTAGTSINGGQLCLATDFLDKTNNAASLPAQQGADLAVMQNANLGNGYTLQAQHFYDGGDPIQGAQNMQMMLSTPCILAMVGPFNSRVAVAQIPLAANNGLVIISPANTNPGLTLQQYAADDGINYANLHPAGKPNVYFRIPGNDTVQGKVDADLTIGASPNGLGASKVYVIDDTSPYGKELADFFTQEFTAKGGTILGRDEISAATASQIPQEAAKIVAAHPDAVFFGGVTPNGGGTLKAQLVARGFNGPMVGGDGIAEDPQFLTQAGSAANNTYATWGVPDLSTLTSGAQAKFLSDYRAAFSSDPSPYSAFAYDAAMIEIMAIKQLITSGMAPTRTAVIAAVQNIQYDGVTGHISFDANGDNAGNRVFSIYQVTGGAWKFVNTVNA